MIAFATCVADPEKYATIAMPGLRATIEPDSVVIEAETETSIFTAYNEILDAVRSLPGLEALVLLHEDTAIREPGFCAKVRDLVALPDVAVVGVVGAREVRSLAWWNAPQRFGRVIESRGAIDFGVGTHDVETVDGLLMVLSPWAVRNLRFDEETFTGFDGYDADYCAQARDAGKRVIVGPLEVEHRHTRQGLARSEDGEPDVSSAGEAFERADLLWREKWGIEAPAPEPALAGAGARRRSRGGHARSGGADVAAPPAGDVPSRAAGVRAGDTGADDGYFEFDRPELRALVPPGARRVLDVGCGAGAVGAALKAERGIEVVGLEGFPEAAARAQERLDDALCVDLDALEGLPFAPGAFDAMVLGDVLEHLRDPHRLLRSLRPFLADDGVLVCSIPNVKHWSVLFPLLVHDRWEYQDAGLLDRTHVHFFTLAEIDRMLTACGYRGHHVGVNDLAPLPDELRPLVDLAVRFGADRAETAGRLGAYQYLVVAGRAA